MVAEYLNKENYEEWNRFVDESKTGSIFSKTWYLDALGMNYKILVVRDNQKIQAGIVLPKNEINIYSNPMFDKYLGIIYANFCGDKYKVVSKEYKYAQILAKEVSKFASFDYYFHPNFKNWIPLYWEGFYAQLRYTYIIDNQKSLDEIYNAFQKKIIKKNIDFALKNGITVRKDIDFETFWMLVNKTYLRQGSKAPFSKDRIKRYINELQKRGVFEIFGAIEKDGRCSCVCGVLYEEKSSYLLFNGIDIENMTRGANALMIWESIKYFHSRCKVYDFEGSMLPGAEPFFRKFGGELVPYIEVCNNTFFNFFKKKAKKFYKKLRYGR